MVVRMKLFFINIIVVIFISFGFVSSQEPCFFYYDYTRECNSYRFEELQTTTPISDNCYHWTKIGDFYVIKQNFFASLSDDSYPKTGWRINWSKSQALLDVDSCFNLWLDACNGNYPGFVYGGSENPQGNFVWDRYNYYLHYDDFFTVAMCLSNLEQNILTSNKLDDFCCPTYNSVKNKYSMIAFNDSPEFFYIRNPECKWTTSENGCDGSAYECFDFIKIFNHALGRYFGISEDRMSQSTVMSGRPHLSNLRGELTDCDKQRIRYLYCDVPLDVKEMRPEEEISLTVYPNPSNLKTLSVNFNNTKSQHVKIYLNDVNGNKISYYSHYFSKGETFINYPIDKFISGPYVLLLEFENVFYSFKVIINQ